MERTPDQEPEERPSKKIGRREPTKEELEIVTRMLAEGKSIRAIARETSSAFSRAKRLCHLVDVQTKAIHLRETEVIPNLLEGLLQAAKDQRAVIDEMAQAMIRLQAEQRKVGKAMRVAGQREWKLKQTVKTLKADTTTLRTAMRKRGLMPPV